MAEQPVLIAAGGTGGHVFPALAVARELRDRQVPVVWVGTDRGIESRVVPEANFPLLTIGATALRSAGIMVRLRGLVNLVSALASSVGIVRRKQPVTVLGMGGYVSGPVCLAARLCGHRVVVHEQNAVAGFTNRILARVANRVLEAVPGAFAKSKNVMFTGNPVRDDILSVAAPGVRMADRDGPIQILIVGGSQGARCLNEQVPLAIAGLNISVAVTHQCGTALLDDTRAAYRGLVSDPDSSINVLPFIEDMAMAYSDADLIICRAGAMTVAELAIVGLASILVPFPYAVDDHQTANAKYLCDAGAAVLLPESELNTERLTQLIRQLAENRSTLLDMAEKGRSIAKRDATECVVREILAEVA